MSVSGDIYFLFWLTIDPSAYDSRFVMPLCMAIKSFPYPSLSQPTISGRLLVGELAVQGSQTSLTKCFGQWVCVRKSVIPSGHHPLKTLSFTFSDRVALASCIISNRPNYIKQEEWGMCVTLMWALSQILVSHSGWKKTKQECFVTAFSVITRLFTENPLLTFCSLLICKKLKYVKAFMIQFSASWSSSLIYLL